MSGIGSARLGGIQLALRAAIAASAAAAIAQALTLEYPIYAFLAGIIVTDVSPLQSRQLGLRRLLATLLGALAGAIVSVFLQPAAWAVGIGIFFTIYAAQRLHLRSGAKVAGYICAIVVLHFASEPWNYAFDRFVETALGVLVAWFISFMPRIVDAERDAGAQDQPGTITPWYRLDDDAVGPPAAVSDLQLALRTSIAAAAATFVAQALKLDFPVFACIAAVITTDLVPGTSRDLGVARIATTLIGAACGAFLSLVLPADVWAFGVGVGLAMIACQSLHSYEGAKVAACVCGIGMLMHGGSPGWFAFHRVLETGLGVVMAWLVSHVPKLIRPT